MHHRHTARAAIFAASLLFASTAAAQNAPGAQRFAPAPAPSRDFLSVFSARLAGHLDWEAGLTLHFADNLLVERDAAGEIISEPVSGAFTAEVIGTVGLIDRLEIGLGLPIILTQSSAVSDAGSLADPDAGAGVGDLRLVPRVAIWSMGGDDELRFALAGLLPLSLPTGDRDALQGNGFQVQPTVAAELGLPSGLAAAFNLGGVIRDRTAPVNQVAAAEGESRDLVVRNDGLVIGAAVDVPVEDIFAFVAELNSEIGFGEGDVSPVEVLVGGEFRLDPGITAGLAFGRGLSNGLGAPSWRLVAGASYAWDHNRDRDGDELLNRADACPDAAEDLDDFEDLDGCPDPDNDGDGVLDAADNCRNTAEDIDGFRDEDGCPDPDNDDDGLLDAADACPDAAEDLDGFEDLDGCPDDDNDGDGVLDSADACRDQAEDVDGFRDEDGCPEDDNDGDGVLDAADACPDAAEVINGMADFDGCPDEAPLAIRFAQNEIDPLGPLGFAGTSDDLTPESAPVVEALANAFAEYPTLRVRVVVHSGDRSSDDARLTISQRRADAIVEALVELGVDPARLQTTPYSIPDDAPARETRIELRLAR
jgi:outer membrane protein OmpA-like peptidoglycan-associated protein